MCNFKSGIILKGKVVLAPIYNDSHSALLKKLNIEDNSFNATKVFVRAELLPPRGNVMTDIKDWRFKVDQDLVPDWFELDREKYEEEFRQSVTDFVKKNFVEIAGKVWTPIKLKNNTTYYLLYGSLCNNEFGKNNNYAESSVRAYLNDSDLVKELKEHFGNKLLPITLDLTSLDGLHDYKKVEGDYLSLMNLDLYRECRENIPSINESFWLTTADSTLSGCSSGYVQSVCSGGSVGCSWYCCSGGVRPFFIAQS